MSVRVNLRSMLRLIWIETLRNLRNVGFFSWNGSYVNTSFFKCQKLHHVCRAVMISIREQYNNGESFNTGSAIGNLLSVSRLIKPVTIFVPLPPMDNSYIREGNYWLLLRRGVCTYRTYARRSGNTWVKGLVAGSLDKTISFSLQNDVIHSTHGRTLYRICSS